MGTRVIKTCDGTYLSPAALQKVMVNVVVLSEESRLVSAASRWQKKAGKTF